MARKKTNGNPPAGVEATRHKDTRKNIPTEELRDFVGEDESAPKSMLYPRDPSLDPQLVWKGKDDQDRADLAVEIVPIYIQEVIEPRSIVQGLRADTEAAEPNGFFPGFYDDMNRLDFPEKIEFYRHDQQWANRMILGNSLLVMTSLAEKEGLKGKVQAIYFDPPYGIKFGSNWQISTRKRDVKDGKLEDTTRQPEQIMAFRDTWRLGIHSYLPYLRDRLVVARDLLTETGSLFVQIGEENVHFVRCLLDEVFGAANHISAINFLKTSSSTTDFLPTVSDYILWYGKDVSQTKFRPLFTDKLAGGAGGGEYTYVELKDNRRVSAAEAQELQLSGKRFRYDNMTSQSVGRTKGEGAASWFKVRLGDKDYYPPQQSRWKTNEAGMMKLIAAGRVIGRSNSIAYLRYLDDFPAVSLSATWTDTIVAGRPGEKVYVVQTAPKVVERCLLLTTDPGDLVLDPTCGSGTTAYVAEQWGRRWITIDTSRVALALARARLMAAKYPYYLLADSPEGLQKEAELTGQPAPTYRTAHDVRKGFVYKRVPHVTLKSIATNPDIREGMTRAEIDAAIARHSESETLYDQPYEDKNRIRVSGPFTVESLSPDRIVAPEDEERPAAEALARKQPGRQDFATMILDNLRKAGVQNTYKNERLKFDRLEPFSSPYIHATGEYTDAEGKSRRVAVTIGPEHGTVTPQQVKEAAKEAVQGVGFDILLVCGFAFDPHVSEEAKRYGKLTVLPTRMNPDLLIGDDLLKRTGAGNLFMVFGEPDIDLTRDADGKLVVEIKGVDVYDPTTQQIRSSSTDDIACWFIDTDYNGDCFFVRHAYFLGADDPYAKLKRALRAEIDEARWSALYSTKSYPFDAPKSGKIAVKVINHYGDEVLKVYPTAIR